MHRAWENRLRVRFLTLTDGSSDSDGNGLMTVADVYEAWNRFRTDLKKKGYIKEYCAVLEACSNTERLHLSDSPNV